MFRKNLKQAKNIPTTEKGGLGVPEVDEATMIETIQGLLNSSLKLDETERKIEFKYNIEHDLWCLDDVKRCFGKLMRVKEKIPLSLVTLNQLMRRQREHQNAESERILRLERDKVSSLESVLAKLKAELATLKGQSDASGTMPMLITECEPENLSVDSDVNDGTIRLRSLTARCADRHVRHSSRFQHPKPRCGSRRKTNDVCRKCGDYGHWARECRSQGRGRHAAYFKYNKEGDDESMFCKVLELNDCKVNDRPVESQCGTKLTRAVQRARVVCRHPEPRDGERTLCEKPQKVLSFPSAAAVMVHGELTAPTAHNALPQNNHLWWSARGKQLDYG